MYTKWEWPELGLASIQPIVLRGATWAGGPCPDTLRAATEPNPEVSISSLQLLYEPLYQSLLAFCFDAEQLASIQPAGLSGILKGQPPPAVQDVGHLVAWALCPTPADPLAWTPQSASGRKQEDNCRLLCFLKTSCSTHMAERLKTTYSDVVKLGTRIFSIALPNSSHMFCQYIYIYNSETAV